VKLNLKSFTKEEIANKEGPRSNIGQCISSHYVVRCMTFFPHHQNKVQHTFHECDVCFLQFCVSILIFILWFTFSLQNSFTCVNSWNKLYVKLSSNCPSFNKDVEAIKNDGRKFTKTTNMTKLSMFSHEMRDLKNVSGICWLMNTCLITPMWFTFSWSVHQPKGM
jgi:hypothetical protein